MTPDAARPHRAPLFARLLPLLARHLGLQPAHIGHGIHIPGAVGGLPQDSRSRAGPYRVGRDCIGEVKVPLGTRPRAFLADARLYRLRVGIEVAALESQPADARDAQLVVSDLYIIRNGEAILRRILALEGGVRALTLEEGTVGIRQVLQNMADLCSAIFLQPGVLGVPPPRRELLVQAEAGQTGRVADAKVPPAAIGMALARQKVIPHKPAGSRRAGQMVGRGVRPRQQPQPHAAVDGLRLCGIGRSRHGIQASLSVREW